uniref:Hemoglobin subunit alpha-2 n=1 Tax=Strigops habroptila TaxID=2489341 RepID=A0A672TMS0_STRHB
MLTAEDKKLIHQIWEKASGHLEDFGAEALERSAATARRWRPPWAMPPRTWTTSASPCLSSATCMPTTCVSTLSTSRQAGDRGWGTGDRGQGPGWGDAVHSGGAEPCFALQLLSQCFQVVLAVHLGKDYTPEVHSAFDKFLSAVASVLAEKYR